MPQQAVEPAGTPAVHTNGPATWLDLGASQAAWWWCILGTRSGRPFLPLLGPVAYVLGHALLATNERRVVVRLALAGALTGLCGDSLLVATGLLTLPAPLTLGPSAPFMLSLWAVFAVSLRSSAAFLLRRPTWQAALLGAVAGPLAYAGGERLSVLSLSAGASFAVALEWAFAVPLLAHGARALAHRVPT